MRVYYGSRISDHLVRTPEGYLICKDVPIARTGIQQYRGIEFGGKEPERIYDVNRPEEEVFSPATLASFEGKPVVDEHPQEDVGANNSLHYLKGACNNVHRGSGDMANCIVADLIIYDDDLIRKIENGKRDISCGYDCLWEPAGDFGYTQKEIRGNHVAVVDKGRAGHKVSIRDSDKYNSHISKGGKRMSKRSLWGRMVKAFINDADTTPEDVEAAMKLKPQAEDDEECDPKKVVVVPEEPAHDDDGELAEKVARLESMVSQLLAARKASDDAKGQPAPAPVTPKSEPDALDALENELKGGTTQPQQGTAPVPVEQKPAGDEDPVDVPPQQINRENGETNDCGVIEPNGADQKAARDAALNLIQTLKPIIAGLPEGQRKAAADSMAMLIRGNVTDSQYGVISQAFRNGHKAKDSAPIMDDVEYGRLIRDRYNPHYNHKKED